MGLGEIPAGNLRAYYKLENVNDSSGNGFTLTNNNSVPFNAGKFSNAADFGTSGTNKGLSTTSVVTSIEAPTNLVFSFWFKFNNTSTTNSTAIIFSLNTDVSSAAGGILFNLRYSFNIGVVTLNLRLNRTTVGDCEALFNVDSEWHHILCTKSGSDISINVDNNRYVDSGTAGGGFSGVTTGLVIGNNSALTAQGWVSVDEFIIEEAIWNASKLNKYYTQAKGRFGIY